MAKIYNFPTDWGKHTQEELFSIFANDAICASTDENLIDSDDIEDRLSELRKNDRVENRSWATFGLLFFNDVLIMGNEETWTENKITYNGSQGYAVYTSVGKLPVNKRNFKNYFELCFRFILEKLNAESNSIDIYVNPGDKNGWTFSLGYLRMCMDIANKATAFADDLMKKGLTAENLTNKLFERFDFVNVEITLKDGTKLMGEVEAVTFGNDENAHYEMTTIDGTKLDVYRKDIAFIKQI
ncbi:MAG: hypothetical protein K2L42_04925 [Clostridia bacterium]|nr:hypothetical protein [Clostridia bacterium]